MITKRLRSVSSTTFLLACCLAFLPSGCGGGGIPTSLGVAAGFGELLGNDDGSGKNGSSGADSALSWTNHNVEPGWSRRAGHSSFAHGGKLLLAGGLCEKDVWETQDGLNWEKLGDAEWSSCLWQQGFRFQDEPWMVNTLGDGHGSQIWRSEDGGISWSQVETQAPWGDLVGFRVIPHGGKLFLAGGVDETRYSTAVWVRGEDGKWSMQRGFLSLTGWEARAFHEMVSFNGRLLVIGGRGSTGAALQDVWQSEDDGVTWEELAIPDQASRWGARWGHRVVVFGDKLLLSGGKDASGLKNDIWESEDGASWSEVTSEDAPAPWRERASHAVAVLNGSLLLLGGEGAGGDFKNDVWKSEDGANWTQLTNTDYWWIDTPEGTVFRDRMWIIGGGRGSLDAVGEVWSSEDGVRWTQVTTIDALARWGHTVLVFQGKLWLLGGYSPGTGARFENDVWSSEDGENWTRVGEAPWEPRAQFGALVFNDRMWVIGGRRFAGGGLSDVWWSDDGEDWEQATGNAAWPGRGRHTALVFNERMWVLGGESAPNGASNAVYDDAWYSTNGAEWLPAAASITGAGVSAHGSVVFDDEMWILGGFPRGGILRSEDGIQWRAAASTGFEEGSLPQALVFRNRIWVLGGARIGVASDNGIQEGPEGRFPESNLPSGSSGEGGTGARPSPAPPEE